MNRLLTFHYHETTSNEVRMAPSAYYIEAEYEKVAVRVYAEEAPIRDAKFDVFVGQNDDDGVSIFSDQGSQSVHKTTGVISTLGAGTEATLAAGQNSEEAAENFNDNLIQKSSWVWCNLTDAGGGRNFTVQLELHQVSEDGEPD